MEQEEEKKIIKKTIVIHPIMDDYVRKTWAMLIEDGYDATYSSALNLMLLVAIMEAKDERGLTDKTKAAIWDFAADQATIGELNLQEHLAKLRDYYQKER